MTIVVAPCSVCGSPYCSLESALSRSCTYRFKASLWLANEPLVSRFMDLPENPPVDSAFSSESLRVFQLFRGTFCERLGEFDGRKSATCPVEAAVVAEGLVVAVPVNGSVEHPAVAHISEPAIANETNARMM